MNEIICPHCDKAFKVDETGYANILKQVRDSEFEKHLSERSSQLEKDKTAALKLAEKDAKIALKSVEAEKDAEISRLKSQLEGNEKSTELAVIKAVKDIEQDRDNLKSELKSAYLEKQNSLSLLKEKYETQIQDRDDAIERLKDMK